MEFVIRHIVQYEEKCQDKFQHTALRALEELTQHLHFLIKKFQSNMDDNQTRFEGLLTRFDAATNVLATELGDMKQQIKDLGLPKHIEDDLVTKFDEKISRLEALGKPEETTPPVTTEPPVTAEPPADGTTVPVDGGGGSEGPTT